MLRVSTHHRASQAFKLGNRIPWQRFWTFHPKAVRYPSTRAEHPDPRIALRKSRREWERYHGFGQGATAQGEIREVPDWEYADGTPATSSKSHYHFVYYKNKMLHQIIRAGAEVEKRMAERRIPKIPGTKEQRDWDPQIPLFLEDSDERGMMPPIDAVALDLSEINDIKMKPTPFVFDRRKQHLTRELLVARVPTLKNMMKEDWVPKKPVA